MTYIHMMLTDNRGDGLGWYSPAESPNATPADITLAVPVSNGLFPEYVCQIRKQGVLRQVPVKMVGDSLELHFDDTTALFLPTRGPALSYLGRFIHADFRFQMQEFILDDASWDRIFERTGYAMVGCHPFTQYA